MQDSSYHRTERAEPANPKDSPNTSALFLALDYAARGWPVFPCRPGGKAPLTAHGHHDAATDPDQIRAWWARWPAANIGIPTGERSGILALDVDQPAGLDELEATHGRLPATRTHSTGSGGRHYLYRYPAGSGLGNTAGRLAPGIDTRGEGGYIVAPGSRTTRPYELLDDLPLADTPAWIIEALTRPQGPRRSKASGTTTAIVADLDGGPIPAGARDDTLARIAGRLHDGSRDLDGLASELLEVNAERCQPPLPSPQVEKIARSIHARTPCAATRRATPETVEALESIEGRLWRIEWRGMGELSARDVYVALIKAGREHGELIPAGVRVSISVRALALAAAVSKRTAHYALKRLKSAGVVRGDNAERTGTKSGALVLLSDALGRRATLHHSPTGVGLASSGASLRAPRLRWSGSRVDRVGDETIRSTIRRLGKSCGAVLDALERSGGSATVAELAAALHKTRTRDLRRRTIARLEAAKVVECSGDTVALARDWLEALDREREISGEIAAYQRDMRRFNEQREAYRRRDERPADPIPERPPDGTLADLERVPEPAPALVAALRGYLRLSPRLVDEGPSWLANTLWAYERVQGKPTREAVEAALAVIECENRAA